LDLFEASNAVVIPESAQRLSGTQVNRTAPAQSPGSRTAPAGLPGWQREGRRRKIRSLLSACAPLPRP